MWPSRTRLYSWSPLDRFPLEVDFVGRSAGKRCMWTILVVPIDEGKNLVAELVTAQRDEDSSRAFIFNGPDHTLNDSDTAVFANGTISRWLNALAVDPLSESVTVQDPIPVTDDVLWCRVTATYRPSQ
jgi:hypothetical protein